MILTRIVKYKNSLAISSSLAHLTYTQLIKEVRELIKLIKKNKVKKKDLIAVEIEDSHLFIIAALGCIEGGYSYLPINSKMTLKEKNKIFNFCKPKAVIKVKGTKFQIRKKFDQIGGQKKQICIFFTSGTTSFPKGVCHTPKNLIDNAMSFNQTIEVGEKNVFLHIFPMYYMAGFLNSIICPLLAGNKIVIFDKSSIHNYLSFWDEVVRNKINYFWASPSILNIIYDQKLDNNLINQIKKELKFIMVGTAPFHRELKNKIKKKFNIKCLESYGSSEMLLVSTNLINKTFGSGKILDGIKIKKDSSKNLLISSPFKFYGYLGKNNNIELNKDKFFNSGDTFKKRKKFIRITGRTKDIIIKEGINISPKYLEEELLKIEYNDEVAVVGVKNNLYGEIPIAFIKSKKNKSKRNIIDILKKNISAKILPQDIIFLDKLPKNKIGKIDKNKLIKLYDNRARSFKS
jgi:acyl-coenzyme A synthetase/AMP-(fatty) acid ligase